MLHNFSKFIEFYFENYILIDRFKESFMHLNLINFV